MHCHRPLGEPAAAAAEPEQKADDQEVFEPKLEEEPVDFYADASTEAGVAALLAAGRGDADHPLVGVVHCAGAMGAPRPLRDADSTASKVPLILLSSDHRSPMVMVRSSV